MAAKLSGPGGGKYAVEMNNEINVTPFVDVMLVLLIIFMVAAPLATVSVKVNLPAASVKPARKPDQIIYISIKANGDYYVGDDKTDLSELPDALKLAAGPSHVGLRIFIRGDTDMEYGKFLELMNTMQDNGFYSVALVGEDRSGVGPKS
jgi:TonB system transport protein ExbD (group 1)